MSSFPTFYYLLTSTAIFGNSQTPQLEIRIIHLAMIIIFHGQI